MNVYADIPLIQRVAAELRDYLGEDFDDTAFLDTLDGETNALDVADKLIALALDADAMVSAILTQREALVMRAERKEAQSEAYRAQMLKLLDAMNVKKLERPRATISRRAGSQSVRIVDEASIPSQLCTVKTITSPDKAAIKASIAAGESVPGAEMVTGPDSLTVRVK